MKRLTTAAEPARRCTSFRQVGLDMLRIALIFSGLTSIPRSETMKPSKLAGGDAKHALVWIEFHPIYPKVIKGFSKVFQQIRLFPRHDGNVVNVDVNIAANLFVKPSLHTPLLRCAGIF